MSKEKKPKKLKKIAIIGGGFSGTAVLLNILDQVIADKNNQFQYEITLFNRDDQSMMGGVAYGKAGIEHRTNSWVCQMSAFAHKPDDMIEWVEKNQGLNNLIRPALRPFDLSEIAPDNSFPRRLYQIYLKDRCGQLLTEATEQGINIRFSQKTANVTAVKKAKTGWLTTFDHANQNGPTMNKHFDEIVLSLGHVGGKKPPFLENLPSQAADLCAVDIWEESEKIKSIMRNPTVDKIGVVGTGLTAYDTIMTAIDNGFFDKPEAKMYLISRNGNLHQTDDVHTNPVMPVIKRKDIPNPPHNIEEIPDYVAKIFQPYLDKGFDPWMVERRLRPFVPALIKESGIDPKEFGKLVQKYSSLITSSVAGVGYKVFNKVAALMATGQVQVITASIESIDVLQGHNKPPMAMILKKTGTGETIFLPVDRVLNAAGLSYNHEHSSDPLINQLLKDGIIVTDPETGLGIKIDEKQRPVSNDNKSLEHIHLVGPLGHGREMLKGRVGAFAVNVDCMRPKAGEIASDITGFTPVSLKARQILPSGPEGKKAETTMIPINVIILSEQMFIKAEEKATASPNEKTITYQELTKETEQLGISILNEALRKHQRGEDWQTESVIARHWFNKSRMAKELASDASEQSIPPENVRSRLNQPSL